jgi:hypothetical protein
MSYGTVYCSKCGVEVWQKAFTHEWLHVDDTPRCEGASSVYAEQLSKEIAESQRLEQKS